MVLIPPSFAWLLYWPWSQCVSTCICLEWGCSCSQTICAWVLLGLHIGARLILSKPLLNIYQRGQHILPGSMMKLSLLVWCSRVSSSRHFHTWSSSPTCLCYGFGTSGCFLLLAHILYHDVLLLSCWCLLPEWCSMTKPSPSLLDVADYLMMEESSLVLL